MKLSKKLRRKIRSLCYRSNNPDTIIYMLGKFIAEELAEKQKPKAFGTEVYQPSQEPFDNQEIIDFREKCHKDPQVRENWRQINKCLKEHKEKEALKKKDIKGL